MYFYYSIMKQKAGGEMDIRVLNYFLMVAREENITRASQLLHITQPTLSRQLMQLEEELGVKLFQRSNHSIYLTNDGLLFRRRAQEIVNLADKAQAELKQDTDVLSGNIAIGCGEMRSAQEIAKLITDFQNIYPFVQFELYSGNNENIKERMEQGTLDLGLLLEPVNVVKYDFIRMRTKEQWGVLIHKDNPLSKKQVIYPGELVGTKVITIHLDTPVHHELASWSGDFAKEMESCANYNLLYNAVIVAKEKKGAVICVKLDNYYDDMKFIPFEPKLESTSVLAWKDRQSYSKATNTFISFIKDRYKHN